MVSFVSIPSPFQAGLYLHIDFLCIYEQITNDLARPRWAQVSRRRSRRMRSWGRMGLITAAARGAGHAAVPVFANRRAHGSAWDIDASVRWHGPILPRRRSPLRFAGNTGSASPDGAGHIDAFQSRLRSPPRQQTQIGAFARVRRWYSLRRPRGPPDRMRLDPGVGPGWEGP